jgi:hypothetical protein
MQIAVPRIRYVTWVVVWRYGSGRLAKQYYELGNAKRCLTTQMLHVWNFSPHERREHLTQDKRPVA